MDDMPDFDAMEEILPEYKYIFEEPGDERTPAKRKKDIAPPQKREYTSPTLYVTYIINCIHVHFSVYSASENTRYTINDVY